MLTTPFEKIAFIAPSLRPDIQATLSTLIQFLQKTQINFQIETQTLKSLSTLIPTQDLISIEQEELGKDCDLIIAIGGDGSFLRAAKNAVQYQIPIVGINRGRLGFLTDLLADEIETRLATLLKGEYQIEKRFLLEVEQYSELALNDIVLSSGKSPHMLEFEIYSNDEFVCSERADGLIISTPTGSTAYCLSAGGPIVHPNINAIVILPMFSHTLTNRPIILPGNSKITLKFPSLEETSYKLSCDGIEINPIQQALSIHIQKHARSLSMIHPLDYSYYENLRSKLYWGQKLTGNSS